jgi:hypothetical protein
VSDLWIPTDARARIEKERAASVNVMIDNQSGLDDEVVRDYFIENTAMFGFGQETRYMSYPAEGSMMARSKWRPPRNVIEEIEIARILAERDDDVRPAMSAMIAAAFHGGFHNQHEVEEVEHTFEEMSEDVGLSHVLHEMYREFLISQQINTVCIYTRATYDLRPEAVSRVIRRSVAAPVIGVLPAERVRVLGNDLFGQGELAYVPDGSLQEWLRKYWSQSTNPAVKREMRLKDPVAAALFVGKAPLELDTFSESTQFFTGGVEMYLLNPELVQRTTAPKGAWRYPRPLLTQDLSLLEAKRLLNIMDHAILQGGINYIVLVKKGDEKQKATQPELANLQGLVQRASRSGVLIGDHRLNIELIQPDMGEMLNPEKRRMLGRKLACALLRVPEFGSDETGTAVQSFTEMVQAVVTDDRNLIVGHLHRYIWRECMKRNQSVFNRTDRPTIWMPKVILQGLDFWTQYLLKLYDRGDLPRKYMVEFGGYDYDAVKAQKSREIDNGHDDIFMPPAVPFSSPNQGNKPTADPNDPYRYGNPNPGPNDNPSGRPRGSRNNTDAAPGRTRPTRVLRRTPGEVVRAFWSDEDEAVVRIGEITERVLDEYPDATSGRVTAAERTALEARHTTNVGNVIVIPVNPDYEIEDVQAVRLDERFSMLVGNRRPDNAIVAAAFCFREPGVTMHEAENMVLRWGFPIGIIQADDIPSDADTLSCPSCSATAPIDATECPECGYNGPPFSTSMPIRRKSMMPQQPIALHITVNGTEATVKPEEGATE